jgi:hypothetical protein
MSNQNPTGLMEDARQSEATIERWILVAALLVALAGAITVWVFPPFDRPSSQASLSVVADYYGDNRGAIITFGSLGVLATSLLVAPFVVWRQVLGRFRPTLALIGLVSGVVTIALTACGITVLVAAAFRAGDAVRELSDLGWSIINLAAGPPTFVSIMAFVAAYHWSPYRRRWLTPTGIAIAAAHLVVSAAWAESGFFSPHGAISNLVPSLWFAWIALASLALLLRPT